MNDAYLLDLLSESAEADPTFTRRPFHYETTNRVARAHLRTIPQRPVALPRLDALGLMPFASRSATVQASACCTAPSTS